MKYIFNTKASVCVVNKKHISRRILPVFKINKMLKCPSAYKVISCIPPSHPPPARSPASILLICSLLLFPSPATCLSNAASTCCCPTAAEDQESGGYLRRWQQVDGQILAGSVGGLPNQIDRCATQLEGQRGEEAGQLVNSLPFVLLHYSACLLL